MPDTDINALLDTTYRDALQAFHDETTNGRRHPAAEIEEYRKRRRDYQSWLRRESAPPEAVSLAARIAMRLPANIQLDNDQQHELELATTHMLIRLYDAFIAAAQGR